MVQMSLGLQLQTQVGDRSICIEKVAPFVADEAIRTVLCGKQPYIDAFFPGLGNTLVIIEKMCD